MDSAKEHIKQSNQLHRLSEVQQLNPMSILIDFFSAYHLKDVRDSFKAWLRAGLTSDNGYYDEAKDRSNLILFHEKLEELVEASYLLKENYEGYNNSLQEHNRDFI